MTVSSSLKPEKYVKSQNVKTVYTHNTQVVEERSHSFAFGFPPEGDFAPEAHVPPVPKTKLPHRGQKHGRNSTIWVSKTAQST